MEGDDAYDENEGLAIANYQRVKSDVTLALEDNETTPTALKELMSTLQSSIRELVELFGDTSHECIQGSNLLQKLKKYIAFRIEEIDRAEKKRIREEREAREAAEEAERIRLAEEAEEMRLKEEAEEKIRAYEREKRRRIEEYAASKLFQNQPCAFKMQVGDNLRLQLLASVEFFTYASKDRDFLYLVREFALDCFCRMHGKQSSSRMWLELIASCTLNADIPVFVDVDETVQSGLGSASLRLSACIANARTLPTGWALTDSNGLKTHVNHDTIKMFKETSDYAQKVLLATCSMKVPNSLQMELEGESEKSEKSTQVITEESMLSPHCKHPKFLYLIENLTRYPSVEIACLSALALFKEVTNVKRSKLSYEVCKNATSALIQVVSQFVYKFEQHVKLAAMITGMETSMNQAGIEYYETLYRLTGKSNENELDIPIDLYLQDNDDLRIRYTRFCRAVDKYGELNDEYVAYKNNMILLLVYLRSLYILVSVAVAVHFQFHDKAVRRTFFDSSNMCFGEVNSEDDELFQDLQKIPFQELFEIYHLEVECFGNSTFVVLASTMCYLSEEIQELVGFHIYPSVAMNLLDICKKGESLENVHSAIHSSAVFHYCVFRGCNSGFKKAVLHWSNDKSTSDENVPVWLCLIHEFVKIMNRHIIKDDDCYHQEKIPLEFVNHHIYYKDSQWVAVDFLGSSKYATLFDMFREYYDGLKLATSSHDLEDLQVYEICTYISNCLEFLVERSQVNVEYTLLKFLESPSYSSTYQCSITIMDSFVVLLDEDWTYDYFKVVHKDFESSIDLILKYMKEGNNDHLISKGMSVLTIALSGHRPLYHHPSMKSDSEASRHIYDEQHQFSQNVMKKHMLDLNLVILNYATKWLYSVHPIEHFMSTCPNGSCLATILIRFMTCLTYVGTIDVSSLLNKAAKTAKYEWPDEKPWEGWLAFFMIVINDGICGVLQRLQRVYPNDFQREVFDEDDPRLHQCDNDMRSASIEFLTALCVGPFHPYRTGEKKPDVHFGFCDSLIRNEYFLRSSLSESLNVGNDYTKACVFNIVSVLMKHERAQCLDRVLSVQSYMNMFRLAVGYEGNFILHLYECVDNACSHIQFHIGPAIERYIDNSSTRNCFDEFRGNDHTLEGAVCESSHVTFPPPVPADNDSQFEPYIKKKMIKQQNTMKQIDLYAKSSIFNNQNWEDIDAYNSCARAIDILLKCFECLIEMCDGRAEFMEVIAEKYPGFFIHLPCCLSKLLSSKQRQSFLRMSEIMGGYHVELVRVSAKTLQVFLKRAPVNRKLAVRAGCIEALMDSILECLDLCNEELTKHLVYTMELLVLRDVESWNYLKSVSGIQGLLTLMKAGNHALQISSCSSITSLANNNVTYIEALLETDVLDALNILLLSEYVGVKFSALGLLKVLSSVKSGRSTIMKNSKYVANLGSLLNSGDDLTIVQSVCEVLNLLGTDADVDLRRSIRNTRVFDPVNAQDDTKCNATAALQLPPINIVNRLVEISTGEVFTKKVKVSKDAGDVKIINYGLSSEDYSETGLIQSVRALEISSANVLGCATDSEESDWPDGAPPLRNTLKNSGVLPSIR